MITLEMRPGMPAELVPIWEELVATVNPKIGAVGLEAYCGQVHTLRDAEARVRREGLVVKDVKGNPAPHPGLAIAKQAQAEIRTWIKDFGVRR